MADDAEGSWEVYTPKFERIISGCEGSEGPVFDRKGAFFMVAPTIQNGDEWAGEILKIHLDTGEKSVLCRPNVDGYGGIPAGCQVDQQNALWVADMRLGILKVQQDGSFTQVCKKDSADNVMQGCNDCSLDYHGNLWITAPAGPIAPADYTRSSEEAFGSVYCLTKDRDVVKVDTGYLFSNGIAVQHSAEGVPQILIVAETISKKLWAYDITGPGKVTNKRLWGTLPGVHEGGPDGMDFDDEGNLLVANWGASHLEVFGPEGDKPWCRIKCPFTKPSNLHFKPGGSTVYVTEHDNNALWVFEWKNNGKKQYCELDL